MSASVLPVAETRPTDDRDGEAIEPHVARCPFCPREGTVEVTVQLCHGCGRWFEAVPSDGASYLKANTAGDSGGDA